MAMKKSNSTKGPIGFEDKLWKAANKMRGNMDPAEYKHVVLGLIFLKYISDSFEQRRIDLIEEFTSEGMFGSELESELEVRDYYVAETVFWVPKNARWKNLQESSKKPEIGTLVDNAMELIEKENPTLKGVLPKIYARRELNKRVLGEVFDLIGDVGLGDKENKAKDVLGRVYEYFLGKFAEAEGKGGGQFFTPTSIVRLLVEMIQPYKGRVFDPCCGSGGMFIQSEKFAEAHGGKIGDISIYGQESNPTTWKLAKMNLAIRGIEANLGGTQADSFHNDLHKSLKADFILANPPFNESEWGGERLKEDVRWRYGIPPDRNANFAWVQHFIHHLSSKGTVGFVLANGSLSSQTSGEGEIRKSLLEADLVDCIVSLPSQLFLTTQIPACLWFITRKKSNLGKTLFIHGRNFGTMIDRKTKELQTEDIFAITKLYRNWKTKNDEYNDIEGLCKSVETKEILANETILVPSRYVGSKIEIEEFGDFSARMEILTTELSSQIEKNNKIDMKLKNALESIGFEF